MPLISDYLLPRRKISHVQVAPQHPRGFYMDNSMAQEKIMDCLRIYGHSRCDRGARQTLLRCSDAAPPNAAPGEPRRLHGAPGLL
jgi:hypothetical protein